MRLQTRSIGNDLTDRLEKREKKRSLLRSFPSFSRCQYQTRAKTICLFPPPFSHSFSSFVLRFGTAFVIRFFFRLISISVVPARFFFRSGFGTLFPMLSLLLLLVLGFRPPLSFYSFLHTKKLQRK